MHHQSVEILERRVEPAQRAAGIGGDIPRAQALQSVLIDACPRRRDQPLLEILAPGLALAAH
jgi:hypothetical protein